MQNNIKKLLSQVSEVQLSYKSKIRVIDRPVVKNSQSVYQVLKDVWDDNSLELFESFKVLFLNRANHIIGMYPVSNGGITGTVADPRLIFIAALKICACGIILAHNHPSGNLKPSLADEELTQKIKSAGQFLDIKLLDHLILNSDGYFSFADEGLL